RIGLDVLHVGGLPPVLGDHPERVALDGFPDRYAARLSALPPARLEDHHQRERDPGPRGRPHDRVHHLRRQEGRPPELRHPASLSCEVFDALSDRLQAALGDVRSRGKLTEDDINAAMRQVRLALLEADVNFKVVKEFTAAVKERALGQDVLGSLNPGQQVVKIVSDELTTLMGGSGRDLAIAKPGPTVILMAGLQGSGKTTATGKLARHLREEHGMDVAVAACDVYRPAAVDQLIKVGQQAGAHVYEQGTGRNPVDIAEWALDQAKQDRREALIVDTSGRLH